MTQPHIPPIPGAGMVTDTLDFVKHLWGAMNVPGMAAPTLSVDELDRKIAELKAVEAWISMNAAMLRGSIHTLEVQRATIATLKSMGSTLAGAMPHAAQGGDEARAAGHEGLADTAAAWWDMLQEQFRHAVTGAMSAAASAAAGAEPEQAPAQRENAAKRASKPAAKKTAARKPAAGSRKPAAGSRKAGARTRD